MMQRLPLSSDEIRRILESSAGDCVLVGGQALDLWRQVYAVPLPPDLISGVSGDIDFIGPAHAARVLGEALSKNGEPWKLSEPQQGDFTPQSAKLSLVIKDQGYKEIDFLWSIIGVDDQFAKDNAIQIKLPRAGGKVVKVLHPIDLLASRLHNLAMLPAKRNAQGIAQGNLAIRVVHAFISRALTSLPERDVFPFVEEIRRIALDKRLARIYHDYGFDVLSAIPIQKIQDQNFQSKRWPQIHELVLRQR